jgi:hypothetical protein
MRIKEILIKEQATAGSTSAGNIAAVVSPHIAIGSDRFKKSYTGSPGQSGKRAPRVPTAYTPKNADGTARAAHELSGTSLFGGPEVIRK